MASRSATVSPARAAALDVLLRVFEDDAYADRALRTAVAGLDERDRALAQRLSYGAVQRVRTLDHAIETLGGRRVARLDAPVRAALRLGAYQLAFVDGVARYAAVNESVELVRRAGLERAVAFTNAVLRRLADGIRPLVASLPDSTPAEAALAHSYPGLDRGDLVARARAGRSAGTHACAERARPDRRPARRAARSPVRRTRRSPAHGTWTGSTSARWPRAGSGRRARRRSSSA